MTNSIKKIRFSHQTVQINKNVKLGKLTKVQEMTLMGQVETRRVKILFAPVFTPKPLQVHRFELGDREQR
jgi:hypothetical protein